MLSPQPIDPYDDRIRPPRTRWGWTPLAAGYPTLVYPEQNGIETVQPYPTISQLPVAYLWDVIGRPNASDRQVLHYTTASTIETMDAILERDAIQTAMTQVVYLLTQAQHQQALTHILPHLFHPDPLAP